MMIRQRQEVCRSQAKKVWQPARANRLECLRFSRFRNLLVNLMTFMMAEAAFSGCIMRRVNDPQKLLVADFALQRRQLIFELLAEALRAARKAWRLACNSSRICSRSAAVVACLSLMSNRFCAPDICRAFGQSW
jgi:very-short-patch-repair endonuclease